jgi:hypothetical protein
MRAVHSGIIVTWNWDFSGRAADSGCRGNRGSPRGTFRVFRGQCVAPGHCTIKPAASDPVASPEVVLPVLSGWSGLLCRRRLFRRLGLLVSFSRQFRRSWLLRLGAVFSGRLNSRGGFCRSPPNHLGRDWLGCSRHLGGQRFDRRRFDGQRLLGSWDRAMSMAGRWRRGFRSLGHHVNLARFAGRYHMERGTWCCLPGGRACLCGGRLGLGAGLRLGNSIA